jgi:hypothetical protein
MEKFEPINKKPGELIRSEDWNKIQEDIKTDLMTLAEEIQSLRAYIDSMAKSVTLINLDSPVGTSYRLDEVVSGEIGNYATSVLGYITKQWILGRGKTGEICRFGVIDFFDYLYYWSGAENGENATLEITLEYVDGTLYVSNALFINEWMELKPRSTDNPYAEYLLSPNERVWYKYTLRNPNPNKEVRYVSFKDNNEEAGPRIANVLQHVARIRPVQT